MNILVIGRGIPSEKYPFQGIFEFDQAKALAKQGENVFFIALDLRSIHKWRKWTMSKYKNQGVNVIEVNLPIGRLPKCIMDSIAINVLRRVGSKIIKDKNIDIVHAHFIENGYYAVKALKILNIPIILTEHRSDLNQKVLSEYIKKIGNYTYSNTDLNICVSKRLSEMLKSHFDVSSEIVPNIVDLNIFHYKEGKRSRDVVSVGNLKPEKKHKLLIQSFGKAFKEDTNKLIIIGDGVEKKNLKKLITNLNLTDRVILKGALERTEICRIMESCNIFALTSDAETFGVAFIEALSCGLPVVSTDCGGPSDFIHENNGIIVKESNCDRIADALIYMDRNISKYDREAISSEVRLMFSPESIAKKNLALYRQVLNRHLLR